MKTKIKPFPKAPKLRHLIGPSFILLGLGLGSGEVILWPYLTANYGLGIIWAAVLGITFQFFMNMEIERYALVKGESVFVGFNRMWRGLPYWFMLSTFVGFVWPGMAAASAVMLGAVFGVEQTAYIAIGLLVLTGLLFTLGPILYKVVERFQKTVIGITVPFIFILTIYLAEKADWVALGQGLVGQGDGYTLLPEGIALAVFLSAFAYAGAGGNLNLSQSFYIKEKGYGMGAYAKRITSPVTGKAQALSQPTSLVRAEPTAENVKRFKQWWRRINAEHALVFWLTGAATMVMLSFLAYITTYGTQGTGASINFVLAEAAGIANVAPFLGTMFLIAGGVMLLATQIVVFESSSRIISENIAIRRESSGKDAHSRRLFYSALWGFIGLGTVVLLAGFTEPRALLVLGAVINAFTMFVYLILMLILNRTHLEKPFRPAWWRQGIIGIEILFFGIFSGIVFWDRFFS
ncbi:MAG: Nramp family divalent metal transporter [Patescibacteria group bacterium]|nr:Nramp family divalent metal transporter [Patescibacteria group bacterium]